jgi:hypothetical protein
LAPQPQQIEKKERKESKEENTKSVSLEKQPALTSIPTTKIL